MKRRDLLKSGAGVAAISLLGAGVHSSVGVAAEKRGTYVLVHGAWHGGWCWKYVAQRLREQGHLVYTPSLTGLADRSHLLSMDVSLSVHIWDIANLIKWEGLTDVVLVAHSYGGWPVSGALEHVGDKVASVIFVDAFLPENGQRVFDLNSQQFQQDLLNAVKNKEPGRPVPNAKAFGILDPEQRDWVQRQMTPQPTGVAMERIVLTGARERVPRKAYIRALGFEQPSFEKYYNNAVDNPSWTTYGFPAGQAGHDIMIDAPQKLTDLIVEYS